MRQKLLLRSLARCASSTARPWVTRSSGWWPGGTRAFQW